MHATLNASTLHEAAAMTGESVGAVALRRIRASMDEGHRISGGVWSRLPSSLRELLIAMNCPELDDSAWAARRPWESFTEDQRGRMGAYARWLHSVTEGARWLAR